MKILVIQLARLGDIYMTWPALRALRRSYPAAEIHFLSRPRFEGAVEGLSAIDRHWTLPTSNILAPLVQEEANVTESLQLLGNFIDEVKAQNFDWIINFTFSPASSYLTHSLSSLFTKVSGYSRYKDGTLCLPDEISAYFYAQVGIGKANRVHVADVLASMIDVQFVESDWAPPEAMATSLNLPEQYLVLHVGASEKQKSLSPATWAQTLNYFAKRYSSLPIVLIGAASEWNLADEIQRSVPNLTFLNLAGKTKISDLFSIIQKADLLIGCDSAPIHMASLTDTPTLNVSIGEVNFWETGPKATLGFIYRSDNEGTLVPERLGEVLALLLEGNVAPELITRTSGMVSYDKPETPAEKFRWQLTEALYLGGSYPVAERIEIIKGAMQLNDINSFAMEQIRLIPTKGLEFVGPLLDRAEEVIQTISQSVPELGPLISWYQAEKIRIGPGTLEEICTAALSVHEKMARHIHVYIPQEAIDEEVDNGTL
ncbi:glycosyltransferase family 9 protein [Bdellovibrio reynosensis]|uniref:Glycosyltransferase family 9 protein n=1 Tax=Bdellovibrio reynosensis TaxID=2835041 RepID=A0ABY4C8B3_9BACT|nr:glycosyltransferase family 9 protein [Bdellovibrio reynosensis]UOE99860.1 glycosyltransferase family 9 protein [Bdellovibrio reynosensis]